MDKTGGRYSPTAKADEMSQADASVGGLFHFLSNDFGGAIAARISSNASNG